jgi:hypothetical protein
LADQNRVKHNTKISDMQLQETVDNINKEVSEDKLKEYWKIITSITNNIKDYFLGIYKPNFKNRKANKVLSSQNYNQNMKEIAEDLQNTYTEVNVIRNTLKNNFNRNTVFSKEISNKIEKLKNNVDMIEGFLNQPNIELVSGKENFKNLDSIDEDNTTADVNLLNGSVSLERENTINQNSDKAKVEIQGDSNGFEGTYHEVKIKKQTSTDGNINSAPIKFLGESNSHNKIAKIQDQNPDTWFEYELCNIPDSKKKNPCKGYGFSYKDGTVWAKDPKNPDYLLLHFKVILPEPVKVNYINILPYIPPKDSSGAEVDMLRTYPEGSSSSDPTVVVSESDDVVLSGGEDTGIFQFAPRTVKEVEVKLKKKNPYKTKIGHKFFVRTTTTKETGSFLWISSTDTSTEKKRVPGYVETNPGKTDGFNVLGGLAQSTDTVMEDKVEPGLEWFYGSRWAIGIKDLGVNTYAYTEESKLISKEFISPGEIKRIKLNVKEYIPREFYKDGGSKYNWLKYYISIDDGGEWHEISPDNTNREGIKEYFINSIDPEETSKPTAKNLKTDSSIQRVKLKVDFTRNTGIEHSKYFSPILRGYELKMFSVIEEG